eukprot:CAMPEP_0184498208 /NCGR_PEP_ID=MMETSP0113_2-20130426/38404_1 /TAXON_ID=91329 /ORGANISM="Norrisiella sphaerica, Strain BC52" /LENGTH=136 /DNA_ID=CAMNT_0026885631 /DNA_START=307 /DNA_END=718 /DNA_ORIENTATION=-
MMSSRALGARSRSAAPRGTSTEEVSRRRLGSSNFNHSVSAKTETKMIRRSKSVPSRPKREESPSLLRPRGQKKLVKKTVSLSAVDVNICHRGDFYGDAAKLVYDSHKEALYNRLREGGVKLAGDAPDDLGDRENVR